MEGKIVKGIAGFYYVDSPSGIFSCKAKGSFRNKNIKPLVGDNVHFDIVDMDKLEGNITTVLPRKNAIIRPAVANIDRIFIVLAVAKPNPPLSVLDKYIISLFHLNIPITIVWNKMDLVADMDYPLIYKDAGFENLCVSTYTGYGMEDLKESIRGKSIAFAGPSGVGKSSITNFLAPNADMATSDISIKIERGKHTTRHSEIFVLGDGTYIIDTPGFSSVDISHIEAKELKYYYPEFISYEKHCRFHGCNHIAEPSCAVKAAVNDGKLQRYDNYLKIYNELADIRRY